MPIDACRPIPAPNPQSPEDVVKFTVRIDTDAPPGDLLPPLARLLLSLVRRELAATRPAAPAVEGRRPA